MEQIGEGMAAILSGLALAVVAISWVWRESSRSTIIEKLERTMVSNQARLDAQEGEMDDLRRQIHELREALISVQVLLQEWIVDRRKLADEYKRETGKDPPPEPASSSRPLSPVDLARLARAIQNHFSLDEINTLAFELGVESALSGETSEARARALVDVARRRGLIARLIALYRAQRPNGGF